MPDFSTLSGGQVLLALLVVLLSTGVGVFGHWVGVRQTVGAENTSNRDREFEMLRWAIALAADNDTNKSAAGAAALRALATGGSADNLARLMAHNVSISLTRNSGRPRSAA